jgi:chromosome segregation ATPase
MTDHCSICLQDLRSELCTSISCGHCLHRECYRLLVEDFIFQNECHPYEAKPACPVCKQRIQKMIPVYLTVEEPKDASEAVIVKENVSLQRRLRELQTLSNDQSELLLRILPRFDHLEERHGSLKREKKLLKKQLESLEDENWELLFDCFDAQAKLKEAREEREDIEMKLEETVDENKDLFCIWETLEEQLKKSTLKKKEVKSKLKERLRQQRQELEQVKIEVDMTKSEKNRLTSDLERYHLEVTKLNKKMKKVAKKVKIQRAGAGSTKRKIKKTYSGINILMSS